MEDKISRKPEDKSFSDDFPDIRSLARKLIVYGCYTNEDLKNTLRMSEAKIKVDKRRIRLFTNPKYFTKNTHKKKTIDGNVSNQFEVSYNYLSRLFTLHSFTKNAVSYYLMILQILGATDEMLSVSELLGKLSFYNEEVNEPTLRRYLTKLVNMDIVRCDEQKEPYRYSLANDIFQGMTDDQLEQLTIAVDFFSSIISPSACGCQLFESLQRYKGAFQVYESPFMFNNQYLGQILDDEILLNLLEAMNQERTVNLKLGNGDEIEQTQITPIRIVVDLKGGRRYLFGCDSANDEPRLIRLDYIESVVLREKNNMDIQTQDYIFLEATKNSFSGITLRHKSLVKVKLRYLDSFKDKVEALFPQLMPHTNGDGTYDLDIEVNSEEELRPWLRQVLGKVKVISCINGNIDRYMQEDLKRWAELYGLVP